MNKLKHIYTMKHNVANKSNGVSLYLVHRKISKMLCWNFTSLCMIYTYVNAQENNWNGAHQVVDSGILRVEKQKGKRGE